jgi:hypothetical protein
LRGVDFEHGDGSHKPIATARDRLDELRTLHTVAEGYAQFANSGVQADIEVDKCVGGPEYLLQLLAPHEISGTFQKRNENAPGLFLQADAVAIPV